MSRSSRSSLVSNRYKPIKDALTQEGRTWCLSRNPTDTANDVIRQLNFGAAQGDLHRSFELNQLVDTLRWLKYFISHYFDQISKQGESVLAGDVRRVYRRILLLYVKYRRRQNFERRRLRQPIDGSDNDNDVGDDQTNNDMNSNACIERPNVKLTEKIRTVNSQNISFTRAGLDVDRNEIEDFNEIALAAMRDVANIQNHCVRTILNDHQMKLPIYGQRTRWDSEIPKQRKQLELTTAVTTKTQVEVVKKTGIKSTSSSMIPMTSTIIPNATQTLSDRELFLSSLAKQLSEQTWQQIRSILAKLNCQSSAYSQEQFTQQNL